MARAPALVLAVAAAAIQHVAAVLDLRSGKLDLRSRKVREEEPVLEALEAALPPPKAPAVASHSGLTLTAANFRALLLPSSGAGAGGPSLNQMQSASAAAVALGNSQAGIVAPAPAPPSDMFSTYDTDKNQNLNRAEFSSAHAAEVSKAVAEAIAKYKASVTPAPTQAPIIITSYKEAMYWVIQNMKKIQKVTQGTADIREKYNVLEKHVSSEMVNMTLDQQIWETIRHEALSNTRLTMRLGKQAEELGGIFAEIGSGTTGMIKTLAAIAADVGSFNSTIARNVSQLENKIGNFTNGSQVQTNLTYIVGNATVFVNAVKQNTRAEIKKHLKELINETRLALRNLTKMSSAGERGPCDAC